MSANESQKDYGSQKGSINKGELKVEVSLPPIKKPAVLSPMINTTHLKNVNADKIDGAVTSLMARKQSK